MKPVAVSARGEGDHSHDEPWINGTSAVAVLAIAVVLVVAMVWGWARLAARNKRRQKAWALNQRVREHPAGDSESPGDGAASLK